MLDPRYLEHPHRMLTSAQVHREIFSEIRAGNTETARQSALRHIGTAPDYWFGEPES
jgi:DNA-binding FadR family transcriptional regulator